MYFLALAVILSSMIHLVSSCCLEWIWGGEESQENPTNSTAGDKASKSADCEPPAALQYLDDVGNELLQAIDDTLRIIYSPLATTQQPPSPAEGAESAGTTNKETTNPAGG